MLLLIVALALPVNPLLAGFVLLALLAAASL